MHIIATEKLLAMIPIFPAHCSVCIGHNRQLDFRGNKERKASKDILDWLCINILRMNMLQLVMNMSQIVLDWKPIINSKILNLYLGNY
jgi:hypothetical protein